MRCWGQRSSRGGRGCEWRERRRRGEDEGLESLIVRSFRESTHHAVFCHHNLTVFVGSTMAITKLQDSVVQERTVSVLPSRKSRVMEASYVRQNLPMS